MVEKATVCKKTYTYADGSTGAHAKDDAIKLTFAFANDESIDVSPNDFPAEIQTCLRWFGISEKLGNAYAGATKKAKETGENVGVIAADMFGSLYERLVLGDWVAEREGGGPRIGQLVQAFVNCRAAAGNPIDPAVVMEALKDKETRETVENDPVIVAELTALRAKAAAERAAAAAVAAQDAAGVSLDLIQGNASDAPDDADNAPEPQA